MDPGISESLVELVDFYATTMDYAGVKPDHTQFGKTLRPVIENRKEKIREFVCCEGGRLPKEEHCDEFHTSPGSGGISEHVKYWPRLYAQTDDEAHAKGYMIRSKRHKYVSRVIGPDEFYDLEKDPEELMNVIEDPAYREEITKLQVSLMKWLGQTADVVPFQQDMRFSFEMTWAKVKKYVPSELEDEAKEKIRGMNHFLAIQYCRENY